MRGPMRDDFRRYAEEIAPYLTIMDSVGTSIEELDDYAKLNKPDIIFADQRTSFVSAASTIVATSA